MLQKNFRLYFETDFFVQGLRAPRENNLFTHFKKNHDTPRLVCKKMNTFARKHLKIPICTLCTTLYFLFHTFRRIKLVQVVLNVINLLLKVSEIMLPNSFDEEINEKYLL